MKEVDWLELWHELVTRSFKPETEKVPERYKAHAGKRVERPDPLLDFIFRESSIEDTAIDIGSGTGRWTIPLARKIKYVTAVEPTPAMAEMLKENIDAEGLPNVNIISETWEDASPPIHDIVLCAHGMYASPDLAGFVCKMERLSRKGCYMAVRLPPADGVMADLSLKIYGCRHDSANAVIAYNALYSMGIHANVLVENGMVKWVNATLEDALNRAKRHLCLEASITSYDDLIYATLSRRLSFSNDVYEWPDGMRAALLWWNSKCVA